MTTTVEMLPAESSVELNIPEGEFGGRAIVPVPSPSGTVVFSGGNCPGETCPIFIADVRLEAEGFAVQGASVSRTTVLNQTRIEGTKAANGELIFPAPGLDLLAVTAVNETPITSELTPMAPVTGSYDAASGELRLDATFSQGSGFSQQIISFALRGRAVARLPIANAGPDQVSACRSTGSAAVALDGSSSFDPDGDALTFEWSENGVVLAREAAASLQLAAGAHELVLTVTDATGRLDQDIARIVVNDRVPPAFTFVPPTVFVESPGAVAIGQARAEDGCGSVAVSHDAPASFPLGLTLVTWTATDSAGNRVTAVQEIWVLPAIVASCRGVPDHSGNFQR